MGLGDPLCVPTVPVGDWPVHLQENENVNVTKKLSNMVINSWDECSHRHNIRKKNLNSKFGILREREREREREKLIVG